MDTVALGTCKILFSICKLLIIIFLYSLKILIWILNKLRMTVVAVWILGVIAIYGTNIEWFQSIRKSDLFALVYLILGGIIFVISVFCLLGDIIRLFFPQFSFLDIPDYFSKDKEKILSLTNDSTWFYGLNSKKKIKYRYQALKDSCIYSSDINEKEKLVQIEKEYKHILSNIG